jgi:uncharacterized protein
MGSNPIELTKVSPSPSGQMNAASPDSPCTRVCLLDNATGWCLGCGRTGAEIAGWLAMSAAERLALKAALPARLAALEQGKVPAASQG